MIMYLRFFFKFLIYRYSDTPYKCSHVVEIENLKIFDYNHFSKSYSKLLFAFFKLRRVFLSTEVVQSLS
jgi:hypothetical protein